MKAKYQYKKHNHNLSEELLNKDILNKEILKMKNKEKLQTNHQLIRIYNQPWRKQKIKSYNYLWRKKKILIKIMQKKTKSNKNNLMKKDYFQF